jgi:hypothetical protein
MYSQLMTRCKDDAVGAAVDVYGGPAWSQEHSAADQPFEANGSRHSDSEQEEAGLSVSKGRARTHTAVSKRTHTYISQLVHCCTSRRPLQSSRLKSPPLSTTVSPSRPDTVTEPPSGAETLGTGAASGEGAEETGFSGSALFFGLYGDHLDVQECHRSNRSKYFSVDVLFLAENENFLRGTNASSAALI